MSIEKHFEKSKFADIIFDPIPSYSGDWIFTINNLKRNAKKVNGRNLFQEFYEKTYQKPLVDIFKTKSILDFRVGMVSTPNTNNLGRCLRYSKIDFFCELTNFLCQWIDIYEKSEEERKSYVLDLIRHIDEDNESLNMAYSEALKEKAKRLKDLIDNGISSEYYDAGLRDYEFHKEFTSFSEYINFLYKKTTDLEKGLLKLGDFFDVSLDYKEMYKAFDSDVFYLLFAKIIYEFNLIREKEDGILDNSYMYLYHYNNAIYDVVKENKKYNPYILFTLPNGKKLKYSRWQFQSEFQELTKRHPEIKSFILPQITDNDNEAYKDIGLIEKLTSIYVGGADVSWEFLPEGEGVKRGIAKDLKNDSKVPKDKMELIKFVNMRISILENSGYIGRPIRGLNTFNGYYAFIYPTGKVILEKFWENEETMNPAVGAATYVMNIDNFVELSKMSRISLVEYIRSFPEVGVKRIFHTTLDNWQKNLYAEINGTYRIEDAINFINSLERN